MSNEKRRPASPSSRPARQRKPRLKTQLAFGFGILLLALGAFYTALVVATHDARVKPLLPHAFVLPPHAPKT